MKKAPSLLKFSSQKSSRSSVKPKKNHQTLKTYQRLQKDLKLKWRRMKTQRLPSKETTLMDQKSKNLLKKPWISKKRKAQIQRILTLMMRTSCSITMQEMDWIKDNIFREVINHLAREAAEAILWHQDLLHGTQGPQHGQIINMMPVTWPHIKQILLLTVLLSLIVRVNLVILQLLPLQQLQQLHWCREHYHNSQYKH